jgi:hypothetical protein
MSPIEAINIIKKMNKRLKIVSCKDYGDDYIITAYENEDDLDPFYLVNKKTGKIEPYTIAEDPNKYYSAKELLED